MKPVIGTLFIILLSGLLIKAPEAQQLHGISNVSNRFFLNQTFDSEPSGQIPNGWFVTNTQYGNMTVDGTGFRGNCAMLVDNSSTGNPYPYRYFEEQTNTVGISFTIKISHSAGATPTIEVYIDDGNFNGANLIFSNGKISVHTGSGTLHDLRSNYVADRWYRIKLILNIPASRYNIHIDDHLEEVDAAFVGTVAEIHRIVFRETSGQDGDRRPVAYLDELYGRRGIEVPKDFPTIQKAIEAAEEGDLVYVTGKRTYYESVVITKNIDLIGEQMSTTIIDGGLVSPQIYADGVIVQTSNAEVNGFTITSTRGVGIRVQGSNNIIENNNVTNGLGDGIYATGTDNRLTGNIVTSNLGWGIQIAGSNSTLTDNVLQLDDAGGIRISGSDSLIELNDIAASLGCGILVATGEDNVIRNNTIRANNLGVQCDVGTLNNHFYRNRFIGNTQKPQAVDNGANNWDDGYPYYPGNSSGGGNYWSDFSCFDIFRGKDQDEHTPCCLPAPDGISDIPYNLSAHAQDRYPLFLIQDVSQNPAVSSGTGCDVNYTVGYDASVVVTAKVLTNVTIRDAYLLVDADSNHENLTMTIAGSTLSGTISAKKYHTEVEYNVSVHAKLAVEVNSTNYPLSGPYQVVDKRPPTIDNIVWNPRVPDENQNIRVWAHVTEPSLASGVGGVFLSYLFNDTVWTANMSRTSDDNYTALMPPQPGNATLYFNVSALDIAGNKAVSGLNTQINEPASPTVSSETIDLGVLYRGEKRTDRSLIVCNTGQEALAWNITIVEGGDWLKGISPDNGGQPLGPGSCTTISISADTTTCLDPNLYVTILSVNSNGTRPQYKVIVKFTVRDIAIDTSWESKPIPQRSDVNEAQCLAFHAKWTHNCTEAALGKIRISANSTLLDWTDVNSTGWANLCYKASESGSYIFTIKEVDFIYVDQEQVYHIRSFNQKAPDVVMGWDQVLVRLKISDERIDVGKPADITWSQSVYESDNSPFAGSLMFNDTIVKNAVGKNTITTSAIMDTNYGLTAFKSNTVSCIWDRIKIIGGGKSDIQVEGVKGLEVWLIAIYEYDNGLLKGANGTLFIDGFYFNTTEKAWEPISKNDAMEWSAGNDRWKKSYFYESEACQQYVVSSVEDRTHGLTAFDDLVTPIYHGSNTVVDQLQAPLWAVVGIVVTLVVGLSLIFAIIAASGKKGTRTHAS